MNFEEWLKGNGWYNEYDGTGEWKHYGASIGTTIQIVTPYGQRLTMCSKCGGMAVMDSLDADKLIEEASVDLNESWRKFKPVLDDLLSKLSEAGVDYD